MLVWLALAGLTARAEAQGCANEALRETQGVTYLPDCMALELVTPPKKGNRAAWEPSFSESGDRILFKSNAALGETEGLLSPIFDYYVASRGGAGWATTATSPPADLGFGWAQILSSGLPASFSPDFGRWVSVQATISDALNGWITAYEADLAGDWLPRSQLLKPIDSFHGYGNFSGAVGNNFAAVSDDFSHLFFVPGDSGNRSTAYLPGDPQPTNTATAAWNTYVLGKGPLGENTLTLLARDSDGKNWGGNCGAWVGGGGNSSARTGRSQGAVSADGTNAYMSTRPAQPESAPCPITGTAALVNGTAVTGVATAKGTGTTANGSNEVVAVATTSGTFAVGQTITISGSTVAPGTTIAAVGPGSTLTLSNPVTAGGGSTKALSAGAQPFAVGQAISGPGIASGTTVTAVNGQELTISAPATLGTNVPLSGASPIRILERTEAEAGVEIAEIAPGGPAAGSDFFEGGSADGSKAYFTSPRQIVPGDVDMDAEECSESVAVTKGCDLYLYEMTPGGGSQLIQASAGGAGDPTPGRGANVVRGVTAISGDGSHVYFIARGVLTTDPNPEGEVATPGGLNLYLYERDSAQPIGRTAFVGGLDAGCPKVGTQSPDCEVLLGSQQSYWNDATAVPMLGRNAEGAEIGGDGHVFVFESTAPLGAGDEDGHRSDVYRYDSSEETLDCVSCAPGGDNGAYDVIHRSVAFGTKRPGPDSAEYLRWASEDGEAIVFTTAEALVPRDADGHESPYLWQAEAGGAGKLNWLPGGSVSSGAGGPVVSHDGTQVAFGSASPLLPIDGDSAEDIYVARVDGGYPNPPIEGHCTGEACQGPPVSAPAAAGSATSSFTGKGNVAGQRKPRPHKKKKSKRHHKRKHGAGKARSGK
jgi:hypothetical protein